MQAEPGKMIYKPETIHLKELIIDVVNSFNPITTKNNQTIEIDVDPALTTICIDPAYLKQVLMQYVSNAIKFSHAGGKVEIKAKLVDDQHFRIDVKDTGIGIRAEDIERLFKPFQQLDMGTGKKYQGAGLGLAITRRIVEGQGGEVGVTSQLGKGSIFFVILPRLL